MCLRNAHCCIERRRAMSGMRQTCARWSTWGIGTLSPGAWELFVGQRKVARPSPKSPGWLQVGFEQLQQGLIKVALFSKRGEPQNLQPLSLMSSTKIEQKDRCDMRTQFKLKREPAKRAPAKHCSHTIFSGVMRWFVHRTSKLRFAKMRALQE